jgi:hypothetical protein
MRAVRMVDGISWSDDTWDHPVARASEVRPNDAAWLQGRGALGKLPRAWWAVYRPHKPMAAPWQLHAG